MTTPREPVRHQPSGPGATGGLPGDNADPSIEDLTPAEAASTVSGVGVAPVGDDGTTGTARFEDEELPIAISEDEDDIPTTDELANDPEFLESEARTTDLPGDEYAELPDGP